MKRLLPFHCRFHPASSQEVSLEDIGLATIILLPIAQRIRGIKFTMTGHDRTFRNSVEQTSLFRFHDVMPPYLLTLDPGFISAQISECIAVEKTGMI